MDNIVVVYAVISVLACLLLIAAWYDLKFRRIPNKLVLVGAVLGLLANGLLPPGSGFSGLLPGAIGWLNALRGFGLGLVLFLPLYWLRAMGAGDVKLMAMVGAFLGPAGVFGAILYTFLAGGVMTLVVVARARAFRRLFQNIKLLFIGGMVKVSMGQAPTMDSLPQSIGKLPYALAIAVGTIGFVGWRLFMAWRLTGSF